MMDGFLPRRATRPLDHEVRAVPSKSVTHRAVLAAALAHGTSTLRQPLLADDTMVTLAGVQALGVEVRRAEDSWTIVGRAGELRGGGELHLRESGTSLRFLLALAALGRRPSRLDGSARLRQRPLAELVRALQELGGRVVSSAEGGLPATVGGAAPTGGPVHVRAERSSQFASALLLIGARLPRGLDLTLEPPLVSSPYIELTAKVLGDFGVEVERIGSLRWRVRPCGYAGRDYRIEGDHSSASYFLAAPVLAGGRVRVSGLDPASAQPDARLGHLLERMGCVVARGADWIEARGPAMLRGIDEPLGDAPDLVPTLAVLAMFAEGTTTLRGLAHLRGKESDRLSVLVENLRRFGCDARVVADCLEIRPRARPSRGVPIDTASDHRIAMAFAVAGLVIDGVSLDDPACVGKSHPGFWRQLAALSDGP